MSTTSNAAARPWFREPWPWILMGLPFTAVVACFITLSLAIHSDDGLVAENYYQQGLSINRALDRERFAANLQLEASFSLKAGQLHISLGGREGVKLPERVQVSFMNAGHASGDQVVMLVREGDALVATANRPGAGSWNVKIEDPEKSWQLSGEIALAEGQPATLQAQ